MWVILELNLSIIGGSIPALKPFAQRHCPILLGSSRNASSGSSGSGLSNPYYKHRQSGAGPKPSTNRTRDSGYPASDRDHYRSRASASQGADGDGTGSEECIVMQDHITKTVQYGYAVEPVRSRRSDWEADVEAARGVPR